MSGVRKSSLKQFVWFRTEEDFSNMYQVLVLFSCALLARSQTVLLAPQPNNNDLSAPTPYQFNYNAPAIGGGSSHEQTGDEYGRVTGSYSVADEDGRQRIVNYVADENGFRASISTNEPGTSNENPADVSIESSADQGFQAYAAAPQPVAVAQPVVAPPAVLPFQPTLVPIQPNLIPFNNQPNIIPIGAIDARRFFSQPLIGGFLPFPNLGQPAFLPFANNQFQPIRR
ncbi:cuticle protein 18.6-like [Parasteatoda tepidariorum]|uniref:cuticle protein 18.6-like n=1 Tax=Parasteatoda tepidariorum TaxID=114398 RepID=UPI00077FE3B4|nr:cuticle protein 18.6-like [Parasteatoda tepidariorum]